MEMLLRPFKICLGVFYVLTFISCASSSGHPCAVRKYSEESSVCVCNSTYCDILNVVTPQNGKILVTTSSKDGLRFSQREGNSSIFVQNSHFFSTNSTKFQTIKGFGGALTDAASLNMMNLSVKAQHNLIKSYFGKDGIDYNLIRIPMASCDFSTHPYTYLDKANDFNLSSFALAPEDIKLKIPLLKQIFAITLKKLSLYASPWSAPAWMKDNDEVTGLGSLKGTAGDKYHKTWAEYFIKFFDSYKAQGIQFWGVTMQNEPSMGLIEKGKWQCMGWTPDEQRDFVKTDLGPMLTEKGYGNIKLMIHDDQRLFLPAWPKDVLSDPEAAKFVSGIGVHWYWDWLIGPEVLSDTHNLFPDKFLLATEACNKQPPTKTFGSWEMGEKYSNDILDNLNNWVIGWVDWNLCLNFQGGPNWANNLDNSPIIVNATADEFYKQPMYYHLGHFSKFILEGSVRLHATSNVNLKIEFVAVQRPDRYLVVVVLNKEEEDVNFQITISTNNVATLSAKIPKRSIQTFMWSE